MARGSNTASGSASQPTKSELLQEKDKQTENKNAKKKEHRQEAPPQPRGFVVENLTKLAELYRKGELDEADFKEAKAAVFEEAKANPATQEHHAVVLETLFTIQNTVESIQTSQAVLLAEVEKLKEHVSCTILHVPSEST